MIRLSLLLTLTLLIPPLNSYALPRFNFPAFPSSDLEDLLLPKRTLNRANLGINAFANDQRFGSVRSQYKEVRSTLKLKHVRVLFAWNDQVQPTPSSPPDFSFYDDIARSLPTGIDALVVLTGLPTWMNDSDNWIANNPRRTFVDQWVSPVVKRYKRNSRIAGFQIWNEPNMGSNPDNTTLDMAESPDNYLELFMRASSAIKDIAPRKKAVAAATTAINQNFPETLNYNKSLVEGGLLEAADIFTFHFYGKHIENVILPGGIKDFIKGIKKPIWITESGEKGTLKQREYAQRIFPYLLKLSPNVKRLYIYQFTESSAADLTYGLRNLTPGRFLSDLYIYLRDLK